MSWLQPIKKTKGEAWLITGQAAVLTVATLVFMLLPAQGAPVLAVPLGTRGAATLIGGHTMLLGAGRFRQSLVIAGERPSFWTALTHDRILVLPALPILCGDASKTETVR